MGVTRTKDDLCTNVRITAQNTCFLTFHSYFVHHSRGRHTGSCITITYLSVLASVLLWFWDWLVSLSTEGDGRRGGAAGVFCCLSVSAEETGCRASPEDPADVKQLRRSEWQASPRPISTYPAKIVFIYC